MCCAHLTFFERRLCRCVEWGDGLLGSDITAMEGRFDSPVHGCNEADELGELLHVFGSAPRRKHVVDQVIHVVPYAVVLIHECLHMPPRAVDRIHMSATTHID